MRALNICNSKMFLKPDNSWFTVTGSHFQGHISFANQKGKTARWSKQANWLSAVLNSASLFARGAGEEWCGDKGNKLSVWGDQLIVERQQLLKAVSFSHPIYNQFDCTNSNPNMLFFLVHTTVFLSWRMLLIWQFFYQAQDGWPFRWQM